MAVLEGFAFGVLKEQVRDQSWSCHGVYGRGRKIIWQLRLNKLIGPLPSDDLILMAAFSAIAVLNSSSKAATAQEVRVDTAASSLNVKWTGGLRRNKCLTPGLPAALSAQDRGPRSTQHAHIRYVSGRFNSLMP